MFWDVASGFVIASALLGCVLWLGLFLSAARHRHRVERLSDQSATSASDAWPGVTLIFAARDEAAVIEAATRSMLAIDYPRLRVHAIDDRSTDGTGAILDGLAASDPRLNVTHVRALPEGWLGKTHALQAGIDAAASEWVLLTDADVHFAPDALRRAVGYARSRGIDHLTIAPSVVTHSVGERLFLAMFQVGMMLYAPAWSIADRRSRASVGIGAFNLVRTEAMRSIGGFHRLRFSVDEDLQLGRALKWSGRESRLLLGGSLIRVRWQVGLAGMIRGVEKNFFAGALFSWPRIILYSYALLVVGCGPMVGLFVGPVWLRALAACAVAASAFLIHQVGSHSDLRWYYAALLPASALINLFAMLRSAWQTTRRRGVRWRDHLYPLGALREHVAQRRQWQRALWRSTR